MWVLSPFRKIPGEGNGNLLQYSCLENLKDRGAWQFMGLQSDTTEHIHIYYKNKYYQRVYRTIGRKTSGNLEKYMSCF